MSALGHKVSDRVTIADAVWSASPDGRCISGIVLVHDSFNKQYRAYWGTKSEVTTEEDDATYIARYGNRFNEIAMRALFPITTMRN